MDQRQDDERMRSARELGERRSLLQGFGNGLTHAFELALIPVLFGLLGHVLDRWLGTVVVFAIVFSLVGLVGVGVKLWYGYEYRMRELEAEGAWASRGGAP